MSGHRVVFTPSGRTAVVPDGTTVLEAARRSGADLDTVCGGRGICGRCQVQVGSGEFATWALVSHADHLGPPTTTESTYAGHRPLAPDHRLGCAARIVGDVVVDVPPSSQIHRPVVRKDVDVGDLVVDPIVGLRYVELGAPGTAASVASAVAAALADQWDLGGATFAAGVLGGLHRAAAGGALTVAVRDGDTVVGAWPGFVDAVYGLAVDVGSTTVAGYLCELTTGEIVATGGRMNPQIRFGDDLMSRVSYVMMNPGGDAELTTSVRTALGELAGELAASAGVDPDRIVDVVLVGNPIMLHLVMGIDPSPLGQAPFTLATDGPVHTDGAHLGLGHGLDGASVYVAPCIAGHVGGDAVAAVLAERPYRGAGVQVLVDVGTNAEIVLSTGDHLYAASSPTGPALEGAQISCGQRATVGAIERVRIDPVTLEPRIRVIGDPRWSDEPGFGADVTGICGSGIVEVIAELVGCGVIDPSGSIVPRSDAQPGRIVADGRTFAYRLHGGIRLTQADVRAVQLAKAALRAGIELLFERAGVDSADAIALAGAFGSRIDPRHAVTIGMLPPCDAAHIRSVGNAAGAGAVRALVSAAERREMEEIVQRVTRIETATEPRFQEHFVAALGFAGTARPAEVGPPRRRRRRRSAARASGSDAVSLP